MELKRITDLIDLVAASPLAELEVLDQDGWLKLVKRSVTAPAAHTIPLPAPAIGSTAASPPQPQTAEVDGTVLSPMSGLFYRASAPGEPPFVSEGSQVAIGQTLALIEAMKTLCKIEAEKAGTVRRILVDNGASVDEGQGLFVIA